MALYDAQVGWTEKGVLCDGCEIWFHASCVSVSSSQYSRLNSDDNEWKCFRCNLINSNSSLYHSYNVGVSNSCSILAGPSLDDSVFSTSSLSPKLNLRAHNSLVLVNGYRTKHSSTNSHASAYVNSTSDKSRGSAQSQPPYLAKQPI